MTLRFADSFYYVALLSRADAAHARAVRFSKTVSAGTLTTPWVLVEVANAFSAPAARAAFLRLLDRLQSDSTVTIVQASHDLFRADSTYSAEGLTRLGP
ncbi:MAG: hypothetical protein IT449_14190 [Phycisphaerales bacterium]|nr:hypothetical protein [Phycisphaerales bacterium]